MEIRVLRRLQNLKFMMVSAIVTPFFISSNSEAMDTQTSNSLLNESADAYCIKISFGGNSLTATLDDNATTRAFVEMLPLTLPMMDLYGREMCYRFPDALPTDNAYTQGYEVGEIVYYPPRHSFVILYAQNGERFQMQKLGKIDSGVELFSGSGDVDVTFELLSSPTAVAQTKSILKSVSSVGSSVNVEGNGYLRATAYDAKGVVLGSAYGKNSLVIDCKSHRGLTLVEVIDEAGGASHTKIMVHPTFRVIVQSCSAYSLSLK